MRCWSRTVTRVARAVCVSFLLFVAFQCIANVIDGEASRLLLESPSPHLRNRTAPESPFPPKSSRSLLDDTPIHIALAFCASGANLGVKDNGLTVVRSILAARENGLSHNRRYTFHIVTDAIVERAWDEAFNATRVWRNGELPDRDIFLRRWSDVFFYISGTAGRVSVRRYRWEDLDTAVTTVLGPSAKVRREDQR